jgi:ABC-type antimicrobial peptide transport system permease subunit
MALGATARQAILFAAAPGAALAAIGVAVGLVAARLGATVMRSLVLGVTVNDPATFALAGGAVFVVALIATLAPVLRIVRLDPTRALRQS